MGHRDGNLAHKHAHRLHSIPPRHISTRSLILDHLLWLHLRTRFAQLRAELGMSSIHPDDDDNDNDDGELHPSRQDLVRARSLRLRADNLESVISAMLDQPPSSGSHPHTLPNSVRLRLALATVINDIFTRFVPDHIYSSRCPRHLHTACQICFQPMSLYDGSTVGSGLLRPASKGSHLRRSLYHTKLTTLIPRFLRFSALIAAEFAHEARPTREWYFLLQGLLTRAVLEGYLTSGWHDFQPAQCLLLVGIAANNNLPPLPDPHSQQFDPDGFPDLDQAIRLLFPSLDNNLHSPQSRKLQEESEYQTEMLERLRRVSYPVLSTLFFSQSIMQFCDIPESTQDLLTHMQDLAWSYPAEPLECAVVRFCEAVARWRGKPELESVSRSSFHSSACFICLHSTRRNLPRLLECRSTPLYTRLHQFLAFPPWPRPLTILLLLVPFWFPLRRGRQGNLRLTCTFLDEFQVSVRERMNKMWTRETMTARSVYTCEEMVLVDQVYSLTRGEKEVCWSYKTFDG